MLERDKRIKSSITLNDMQNFFSSGIAQRLNDNDKSAEIFFLEEDKEYEYVDFIFFESSIAIMHKEYKNYIIISDKLKPVFSKYNPKILFKPLGLINREENRQYLYWICMIAPAIATDRIMQENEDLYPLVKPYYTNRIIRLEYKLESRFIITLEVAESILRRNCLGATLEKITIGVDQNEH